MVWRPRVEGVRMMALASSIAALTAACSQSSGPSSRGMSAGSASVERPYFTEDAYGVRTSARVVTGRHVPKGGGSFKLGSPYKVAGRWYVPREEPGYDRQGVASWYGDDFHGRKTANGEIFDRYALSAAHPTLPLPSYAYVTNLQNGRTILVRVNDRGPYVAGRIIDLSHASATALGYAGRGHTRVRVRYAGRAPLNGDDRRERAYLADQQWNGGRGYGRMAVQAPQTLRPAAPVASWDRAEQRWSPTAYRQALATRPSYLGGPREAGTTSEDARTKGDAQAFLDAGIFDDLSAAERTRRTLSTLGEADIVALGDPGPPGRYRVRLGPMSVAAAKDALVHAARLGLTTSSVVFE